MKIMSRDFTKREKVLIAVLIIILAALCYYWFVDIPVRDGIAQAKSKKESLQLELNAVNQKIADLEQMESELEELGNSGLGGYMGSYNNSKEELAELNDVLSETDEYAITFAELTREGDLVRRGFSIQFTTNGYDNAKKIIIALENSKNRCRIGDLACEPDTNVEGDVDLKNWKGKILVSATATFYETMVGGVEDEGLPVDESDITEETVEGE